VGLELAGMERVLTATTIMLAEARDFGKVLVLELV